MERGKRSQLNMIEDYCNYKINLKSLTLEELKNNLDKEVQVITVDNTFETGIVGKLPYGDNSKMWYVETENNDYHTDSYGIRWLAYVLDID